MNIAIMADIHGKSAGHRYTKLEERSGEILESGA